MSRYLLLLPLIALLSCLNDDHDSPVVIRPVAEMPVKKDSFENYNIVKQKFITTRDSLRTLYHSASNSRAQQIAISCEEFFSQKVVEDIIAQWYGTPWDFNGITQEPRQGQIACGYFVTTVLRDAGFTLNRIRLAQSPSSEIIKAVADKNSIRKAR
jgi:hypothetical protein